MARVNRRNFMQAILAAGVAPYVVTTAGVLMPVRQIMAGPLPLDLAAEAFLKLAVAASAVAVEASHLHMLQATPAARFRGALAEKRMVIAQRSLSAEHAVAQFLSLQRGLRPRQ